MQISTSSAGAFFPATPATDIPTKLSGEQLSGEHLQALGQGVAKQAEAGEQGELRDKFQDFVGQTFFAELIKSLRSSQKGAAYFNGGRAEEVFQGQFDQMMTEHLSDASAKTISDPMFELFQMGRVR